MDKEYNRFLLSELLFKKFELKYYVYPQIYAEYLQGLKYYEFEIEKLNILSSIMRFKMKNLDASEDEVEEKFKDELNKIHRNEILIEDSKDYLNIDENYKEYLYFLAEEYNPLSFEMDESENTIYESILDSYSNLNYKNISTYVEKIKSEKIELKKRYPTEEELNSVKEDIKDILETLENLDYSEEEVAELTGLVERYKETFSNLEEEYNIKMSGNK